MTAGRRRPTVVLCPHFEPDTAPTGHVMTRIVAELTALGHEIHVVTSLPWYREHRIEPGWGGRLVRTERTAWGSISRVHPFPGGDRRNLLRRSVGFVASSTVAAVVGLGAGGWFRRVDAVIAMSPPLTLGITGWLVSAGRRGRFVFNVQDVFPDAAVETGAIRNRVVIAAAAGVERWVYRRADAVTVLSDGLRDNVTAKLPERLAGRVHVIPNFVDTAAIVPGDRMTALRAELGLDAGPVALYAGNVGFSQSLDLVVAAARVMPHVTFLVVGDGAARAALVDEARDVANLRFSDFVPAERLSELLATGDVHLVPLKPGLGRVSVPSKTYSIMAAARPVVASIDRGTAVPSILAASGAGIAVEPGDVAALVAAIGRLIDDAALAAEMGRRGRAWVEREASPQAAGVAYDRLVRGPAGGADRGSA